MKLTPTPELNVMTFNIRFGTADDGENSWPYRMDAVIEFLGSANCEVIGLQEVLYDQLREIQAAHPFYHWVGVAREDGAMEGEYAAILYDSRKVTPHNPETFWFSETPSMPGSSSWGNRNVRACTHATFVFAERTFEMYNLHIDHESEFSRLKSIELLAHRIQDRPQHGPVIITGDFNDGESGATIELMSKLGFLDTYRDVIPAGAEQATYHGWTDIEEGQKIDYIFLKGNATVVDSTIMRDRPYGKFLSDHSPVKAILELLP